MKDWEKLLAENPDLNFQQRFIEFYALSSFLYQSVWMESFEVEDDWGEAVVLSAAGQVFRGSSACQNLRVSDPALNLFLFSKFFHRDLLVDVEASNAE